MSNLRILYEDKLIAATGGLTPSNLLTDYKSQTSTAQTFQLTTTPVAGKVAVVAMLAEHSSSVSMNVAGVTKLDTSTAQTNQGTLGKYISVYLDLQASTSTFTVQFSQQVKVARFLVGNYWEPVHNTSFGIQVGYEDASSSERLYSGDIYTTVMSKHKILSLDLPYVVDAEKFKLFDIVKTVGKRKAIFVSAFPSSQDVEKEQMYSIYGKFTNLPSITYAMFTKYTSSLQLEEI